MAVDSSGQPRRGRPLEVGLFLPLDDLGLAGRTPRWADLRAMAALAEEVGFDSIWLPDHLLYRFPNAKPTGQWDCLSMLAGLAAATKSIDLGTLVVSTSFREPAILAKMVDTIEEISGGRLILGLGAGYHEPEYAAFGFPYDHRASRFEEALTIVHGLLRNGSIDFQGRFYSVRDCELRPRGPRVTGPPIIVGARGERMLRATARLADGWNAWLAFAPEQVSSLPDLLVDVDNACRQVDRNPSTLRHSTTMMIDPIGDLQFSFGQVCPGLAPGPIVGTSDEIARVLCEIAVMGVDEVQVYLPTGSLDAMVKLRPVLEILDQGRG